MVLRAFGLVVVNDISGNEGYMTKRCELQHSFIASRG